MNAVYPRSPSTRYPMECPCSNGFDSAYGYVVLPKIDKEGLMYEASLAGQKYGFKPVE